MTYFKSAIVALTASLLWGCAHQQSVPGSDEPQVVTPSTTEEALPTGEDDSAAEDMEISEAPPVPVREFPVESFYSLLVAEIAGGRGRYDIELGNYVQEAQRTRDPGVTARATRIARYLGANQATLNSARLWVELEPENIEALYILSTELAENGQLLEAFRVSERLLALGSTPVFQNIAARAVQATDTQRESLLDNFQRLLAQHPRDLQLLVGMSLLLQQQGETEAALDMVQRALAVRQDDVPAVVLEAQLLFELDESEQALERLQELLKEKPKNRRLRLQYARLLANSDLLAALEQFRILVEQSPGDGDLLLAMALVAHELGDRELSRDAFSRLLDMGEQVDTAHYYLGRTEAMGGDLDAALYHFQQVQQGQDYLPALSATMDILISRGDLPEARAYIRAARNRFSSEAEQFYLLEAQLLARYQHLDAAEAVLTEALTLHPANTDLLYSRAMVNEQRDLIALTEDDLRTIIRYQPNNATALNALGYTLADRTNRYDEAYQLIRQALSINPDDPAIIDSMGWVQYRLGNYDAALQSLRQAMAVFPDHEIAAHLGEVLWVTGKREEARKVWNQGLELDPNRGLIPAVMRRLEASR